LGRRGGGIHSLKEVLPGEGVHRQLFEKIRKRRRILVRNTDRIKRRVLYSRFESTREKIDQQPKNGKELEQREIIFRERSSSKHRKKSIGREKGKSHHRKENKGSSGNLSKWGKIFS